MDFLGESDDDQDTTTRVRIEATAVPLTMQVVNTTAKIPTAAAAAAPPPPSQIVSLTRVTLTAVTEDDPEFERNAFNCSSSSCSSPTSTESTVSNAADDAELEEEEADTTTPQDGTPPKAGGKREDATPKPQAIVRKAAGTPEPETDAGSHNKSPGQLRRRLEAALAVFDAIAPKLMPPAMMYVHPPSKSSPYALAGLVKLRRRMVVELEALRTEEELLIDPSYQAPTAHKGTPKHNYSSRVKCHSVETLCAFVQILQSEKEIVAVCQSLGSNSGGLSDDEDAPKASKKGAKKAAERTVDSDDDEDDSDDDAQAGADRPKGKGGNKKGNTPRLEIDVICRSGLRWIKVKGMSGRNLEVDLGGRSSFRGKALTEMVASLLSVSQGPFHWLPFGRHPQVVLAVTQAIPPAALGALKDRFGDVVIEADGDTELSSFFSHGGNKVRVRVLSSTSPRSTGVVTASAAPPSSTATRPPFGCGKVDPSETMPIRFLNFDVTALVAVSCDTCHGYAGHVFSLHPVLNRQSMDELQGDQAIQAHVLPALEGCTLWRPRRYTPLMRASGFEEGRLWSSAELLAKLSPSKVTVATWLMTMLAGRPPTEATPPSYSQTKAADTTTGTATLSLMDFLPANWVTSSAAVDEFMWIVKTVAGDDELRRAKSLMSFLIVFDVSQSPSAAGAAAPSATGASVAPIGTAPLESMIGFEDCATQLLLALNFPKAGGLLGAVPSDDENADGQYCCVRSFDVPSITHLLPDPNKKTQSGGSEEVAVHPRGQLAAGVVGLTLPPPKDVGPIVFRRSVRAVLLPMQEIAEDEATKVEAAAAHPAMNRSPVSKAATVSFESSPTIRFVAAPPKGHHVDPTAADAPTPAAAQQWMSTHAGLTIAELRSPVLRLKETGRIQRRHKFVFGLGDALHAITITANKQFILAAAEQGVTVCVAVHPARALTERKRLGLDNVALAKQKVEKSGSTTPTPAAS